MQSQVELRVQADYTIKVSGGDLNLCRAYFPFKCVDENGTQFSFSLDWENRTWYDENGDEWTPTDVHDETTINALKLMGYEQVGEKEFIYKGEGEAPYGLTVSEKDFEDKVRDHGKRVNFSKNYGVGLDTLCENLNIEKSVGLAMIQGYETAFPEVITYGRAVANAHSLRGYVQNLYGRRYYLKDARDAYRLGNYLVQGTCADAVKEAIISIDKYIRENNLKTRMLMPVHDEIQFEGYSGEESHVPELRKFLEVIEGCEVPIIADVEYSYKNSFEKEKWDKWLKENC